MQLGKNIISLDPLFLNRLMRQDALASLVRVLRIAIGVLCALLLLIFIRQAVLSILSISNEVSALKNALPLSSPTQAKINKSKKITTDYAALKSNPIFGTFEVKAKTTTQVNKPISNLALLLIGTFMTTGEGSYAIIEDDKKKTQDVFNIGDKVFSDAKLVAIYSDRVDIERNGKIEVLKLDLAPGKEGKSPTTSGISEVGSDEFVVDEGELNRAIENLPLVLTQARAVPYFKDGRSVGLRMFAIRSGSIFEKIGLKNGDILKSVNGQSLADLTQAVKLFEKLKEERSVNVVLERDRGDRDFKYQIR
jgi:type II secretion system protein C